jgi:hypothetical protein
VAPPHEQHRVEQGVYLGMSFGVGLTSEQLGQVVQLVTTQVSAAAGKRASNALAQVLAARHLAE